MSNINEHTLINACYPSDQGVLDIDTVKRCISEGVNVNFADSCGWTPLYCASMYDEIEIVEILLEAGADPNIINNRGQTPLYIASIYTSYSSILYLYHYDYTVIIKLLLNATLYV